MVSSKPVIDPLAFGKLLWPNVEFYKQQQEILYSLRDNEETFVPAGNQLGKDFVAAFACLWFFISRQPCRIITTSVNQKHIDVLWGEVRRFIQTATYPLHAPLGPLVVNDFHLRKMADGFVCGVSYMKGIVSEKGEGMSGHHVAPKSGLAWADGIPRTLFVADECSGIPDVVYDMACGWKKRALIIGNPHRCTNFFYRGVKAGDLKNETNGHYQRKIIRIRAEDSPNVRAKEMIVPGVISYQEYQQRRILWNEYLQCVGLDAEFYEGRGVMLFPVDWLNRAEHVAENIKRPPGVARAMGVDAAEGGDNSCWAIVDHYGLIELVSLKTPDTVLVTNRTLALMREHGIAPERVLFDQGGGGKEHADRLRSQGYNVRTVAFGQAATNVNRFNRANRYRPVSERRNDSERRYIYRNRRAEMYGTLREKLDPAANPDGFGIPAKFSELKRQLSLIPMLHDGEGRLELPPKSRRGAVGVKQLPGQQDASAAKQTLTDIIGHSPDESDALVLAVFALVYELKRFVVTAM